MNIDEPRNPMSKIVYKDTLYEEGELLTEVEMLVEDLHGKKLRTPLLYEVLKGLPEFYKHILGDDKG